MLFSVYVIRLSKEATKQPQFVKANPEYDRRKPCVYVGSTALTPAQRYCNHVTKW